MYRMSSQIAKLTDDDVAILSRERTSSVILMTIVISILVLASIALFAFFYLSYAGIFSVIVGAFVALIPLFPAYIVFSKATGRMREISDEIHKGVKNVSLHPIEKQFIDIKEHVRNRGKLSQDIQMTYKYCLIVRGERMEVSEDEYYKCKEGQLVELHEAPTLKKLLSFKVLDKFVGKSS
jgi:hypothetical protein